MVNIASNGVSAHAYIIEGRPGSARDEFVTKLISRLECTSPDEKLRPCGSCDACRQIAADSNPDVVRMSRTGKKDTYVTKDAISFAERLEMRPYGRYLIGVIEDADILSEIVQNKLLKTLEEPPEGVVILLTASNCDDLLPTVRSRCVQIRACENGEAGKDEDRERSEELINAAHMLVSGEASFYEFRSAVNKNVKNDDDAVELITLAEEELRNAIDNGADTAACAAMLEAAEMACADIRQGMKIDKALSKLFLKYTDV